MTATIRDATESDLEGILRIINHAITNTTAVWSLAPATLDSRRAWLIERQSRNLPVVVATDTSNKVTGFASFGDFRPWAGYVHTVEHSLYVDSSLHRRGIGRALLTELVCRARALDKHVMVGGIEANNIASIRLHESMGFKEAGRLHEVAVSSIAGSISSSCV